MSLSHILAAVLTLCYRERPADTRKTEAGVHSASSPNAEREAEDGWLLTKGNEGGEGRGGEAERRRAAATSPITVSIGRLTYQHSLRPYFIIASKVFLVCR